MYERCSIQKHVETRTSGGTSPVDSSGYDLFLAEIGTLEKARSFCERLKRDSPAEYGALVAVIKERHRLRSF